MGMGTGRTVGQTRFCVGGLRVTMGKLLMGLGWEGDPWRAGADHLQQSAAGSGAQADPNGNSSGFKGASLCRAGRHQAGGCWQPVVPTCVRNKFGMGGSPHVHNS